jgi:3-hydroxyacyl-[acyl-carrier-protein] dehydratase
MKEFDEIRKRLPYGDTFRFVDGLDFITDEEVKGYFVFKDTLPFYQAHFEEFPITPAVILVECMAQIGLACLGIYLERSHWNQENQHAFVFTAQQTSFLKPVFPNEKVWVHSKKIYYRFGKLKCAVSAFNSKNELVCQGNLEGMMIDKNKLKND